MTWGPGELRSRQIQLAGGQVGRRWAVGGKREGAVPRRRRGNRGDRGADGMKWVLIGAIRLYQVTLSGLFLNNCRFEPSCSRYGEEALSKHGVCAARG